MAEKKSTTDEMVFIQSHLNAPKKQRNDFGKYNYRSCEDILEAVKPLLKETNCTLTVSDEIIQVADRIYVKATATLKTPSGKDYTTTAFAREAVAKKGLDESQLTGATSSYARKYALNGLFCIDDNKDADALNVNEEFTKPVTKATNTAQPSTAPLFIDPYDDAFRIVKPEIESAPSQEILKRIWKDNEQLHEYAPFKDAMTKRKNQLNNAAN